VTERISFVAVLAAGIVLGLSVTAGSSASAASFPSIPIPARLLLSPQEQPFNNLLLEFLYQDLLEIANDEDEDPEVGEMVVLALLKRQRFIDSLPTTLPVIPLAGGWSLVPVPQNERPLLIPEIQDLYNELKQEQAAGTLDAKGQALLAFIEQARARLFTPLYRVVGPPTTKSTTRSLLADSTLVVSPEESVSTASLTAEKVASVEPWQGSENVFAQDVLVEATLYAEGESGGFAPSYVVAATEPIQSDVIPEPATLLLIAAGLGVACLALRRGR